MALSSGLHVLQVENTTGSDYEWTFSGPATVSGPAEANLIVDGSNPDGGIISQVSANVIVGTYSGALGPGVAWSISAAPTGISQGAAVTLPESGIVI